MKNKFKCFSLIFFSTIHFSHFLGQPPLIIKPQIKNTTIPMRLETVANHTLLINQDELKTIGNYITQNHSLLQFGIFIKGGNEFGPSYWDYSKNFGHEINNLPASRNWKKGINWRNYPVETKYGKWEISLLPFAYNSNEAALNVIRTGIFDVNSPDSVYFELEYNDLLKTRTNSNPALPGLRKKPPVMNAKNNNPIIDKPLIINPINKRAPILIKADTTSKPTTLIIDKSIYKWKANEDLRKYYIRITPLDAQKNTINKISNAITLQEIKNKGLVQQKPLEYLSNDYTITAVKYVPVFYGKPEYASCTIITSYKESNNEAEKKNYKEFENSLPVGTVLCPSPKKEKSWYETIFTDVVGFIIKVIDGGANFYNEIKAYLKNKFLEINCNANLVTNVINPVTKLQEAAGPDVCNALASVAFEYGMAAVGLPPTIPNVDELTKMAQGQIIDLACEKLESETGLPVPEIVRDEIKKEFDKNIKEQIKKGSIDGGSFYSKPHPLGQFQTAYLEIEITRTSNNFKGKSQVGMNLYENTTRTLQTYGYNDKVGKQVTLTGRLFEQTSTKIPFIEHVGEKRKVYIVLKPQESYVYIDKDKGYFQSIGTSPQTGIYNSVIPTNTYQSITYTPGFKTLSFKSVMQLGFGIKIDPSINCTFNNE